MNKVFIFYSIKLHQTLKFCMETQDSAPEKKG